MPLRFDTFCPDNTKAEDLVYADKILVLSEGRLTHRGTYDEVIPFVLSGVIPLNDEHQGKPDDVDDKKLDIKKKTSPISKVNQFDDLTRATGDFTVYKYYFDSIGWSRALIFVSFVILNVFCSTFGRMNFPIW